MADAARERLGVDVTILPVPAAACQAQGGIQLPLGFDYADHLRASDHDAAVTAFRETGLVALPPHLYYETIFHDDVPESLPVLYMGEQSERAARAYSVDELITLAMARPAATPLASFARGWRSRQTMLNLYAFVIDVENVTPAEARHFVTNYLPRLDEVLRPAFVVLSGGGMHFVYHLAEPVAAYNNRKPALDAILRALKKHHDRVWEVDKGVGIAHAVRVVGGATKYGTAAMAFRTGDAIPIAKLAKAVGVSWTDAKPVRASEENSMRALAIQEARTTSREKVAFMPNGRRGFWTFCLDRLQRRIHETNMERRHMALFGLAVVGYKCRVPRAEVMQSLDMLIDKCNRRRPEDPLTSGELKKVMTGYSQQFLMVKGSTLSEWLGVEFRPIKRNGRTRSEHLKRVHAKRRGGTRELVLEYVREHPNASQVEVAAKLDLDRKTVRRYLKP